LQGKTDVGHSPLAVGRNGFKPMRSEARGLPQDEGERQRQKKVLIDPFPVSRKAAFIVISPVAGTRSRRNTPRR
jgi:hypothetical protein